MLVGVRDISAANLPSASWVNTHLQYTHGNGARGRPAPTRRLQQPRLRRPGGAADVVGRVCRRITQPRVYFGLGRDRLRRGEHEAGRGRLPTERHGNNVESHYKGSGGVQLSSIFTRAAFALRLGDFNLLISSQITNKSRIMFVRDPVAMAAEGGAVPQLRPRSLRGDQRRAHRLGASTATRRRANYPYSQNAASQQVAIGSNLPGSYNYVRNSVKVVIDAYTGQMTFYDADPNDPILQAYSAAFPHMFTPLSKMSRAAPGPPALPAGHLLHPVRHLRPLPPDQRAAASTPRATPGSCRRPPVPGPQSQALLAENTYNNQGQLVSTTPARMAPQYQVYSLPGTDPDGPGLHHLGRLRPGVAGERLGLATRTST